MSYVTRTPLSSQKVKGQLVAGVLNSQHEGTGATWRINAKMSTCRGRRHTVSPRAELVIIYHHHRQRCRVGE